MATKAQELENKARVKLELSKKYENLCRISGSKPARGKFIRRSNQLRRQAVEVWSLHLRIAEAAHIANAMIIGHDHNNIGLLTLRLSQCGSSGASSNRLREFTAAWEVQ